MSSLVPSTLATMHPPERNRPRRISPRGTGEIQPVGELLRSSEREHNLAVQTAALEADVRLAEALQGESLGHTNG
jgi:hypothetical protein